MRISVLTLFPDMFVPLKSSIIGRARDKGILDIEIVNIRDYSEDKHSKCDDTPFGGGAGMVMTPQPIVSALNSTDPGHKAYRLFMSPKGEVFTQAEAHRLSCEYTHIVLLCGHYEGIDQRVIDYYMDGELSIGNYVISGGELAAMVVADAVGRLVGGVLGSSESLAEESFSAGDNLEYPQYTRPQSFEGHEVPEVLLSGNHANIAKWRKDMSAQITRCRRGVKEED